jgi:hypothetical protein
LIKRGLVRVGHRYRISNRNINWSARSFAFAT